MGFRYVSRANPRDNTRHVILSTASMRPADFAGQLNVSLVNGWGIVRTVTDLCMKMPEGKYVLVKDPNKACPFFNPVSKFTEWIFFLQPVIRLYAVPLTAFTAEEEEGEQSEVDEQESTN